MNESEIIIIGAGISGLAAAKYLAEKGKKSILLEAGSRTGGRIRTFQPEGFSGYVECGAEFIHGNLPHTIRLLNQAEISFKPVSGTFHEFKNGTLRIQNALWEQEKTLIKAISRLEKDISVETLLKTYFSEEKYGPLKEYINSFSENFDASDTRFASSRALAATLRKQEEKQYRIDGGYGTLADFLESGFKSRGGSIILKQAVKKISWKENKIKVFTDQGLCFSAKKLLITVPLSILKLPQDHPESLVFEPGIDSFIAQAGNIGFGMAMKIITEFEKPFWLHSPAQNALSDLAFIFSDAAIPVWWTQAPETSGILTGWIAGPSAERFSCMPKERILETALTALSYIFKKSFSELKSLLKASFIADWPHHPYILGGYSFPSLNRKKFVQVLSRPVENTIFLAGEGIYNGPDTGTVEAAIHSAYTASDKILNSFD